MCIFILSCLTRIIKGLKNPGMAIKYVLGGGKKAQEKKILSIIQDCSDDLPILEKLEKFLRLELRPYYDELLLDKDYQNLQETMAKNWGNLGALGFIESKMLFVIVRAIKPKIVIETGVANGVSSSMLLLGLEKNNSGKLFSIDFSRTNTISKKGATKIPKNKTVGWLVPIHLKKRWDLRIGDSKKILPILLEEQKECDIFLHDSNHSYEHMTFEFETVSQHVKKLILSDDIARNEAFNDFSSKYNFPSLKITKYLGLIKVNSIN